MRPKELLPEVQSPYFCSLMANDHQKFQAIISHCKEYGFIFPSSEIYDGLSAVYDYGQYGSELKKNIRDYWWKSMTQLQDNIVVLMPPFLCIRPPGKHRVMWIISVIR